MDRSLGSAIKKIYILKILPYIGHIKVMSDNLSFFVLRSKATSYLLLKVPSYYHD